MDCSTPFPERQNAAFPGLEGKRAVVIGGSGGIGRAVSLSLAAAGAELVVHGGHSQEKLEETLALARSLGAEASGVLAAINCMDDLDAMAALVRDCDILVVAFGPFLQKPLEEISASDWSRMAVLNLALPGCLVSSVLPSMKRKNFGRIVLFGGTGTELPRPVLTNCAYASAKTGLGVLVRSAAAAGTSANVAAVAICPGFTDTEYLSDDQRRFLAGKTPGNRLESPEDIARIALFFISQIRAVINGIVLSADSGIFFRSDPDGPKYGIY
jgi:3-oxoacyl-[acyl-carrier protein] reductase